MKKNREIPDVLDGMKKDLPFSLPENYFENFPEKLRTRMETRQESVFPGKIYRIVRPKLAIAAALAAFILLSYVVVRTVVNTSRQNGTVKEYAEIIDYYIYDFDDETIMVVFTDETNLNYLNNNFKSDEIIDYISEEDDFDYSDLQNLY